MSTWRSGAVILLLLLGSVGLAAPAQAAATGRAIPIAAARATLARSSLGASSESTRTAVTGICVAAAQLFFALILFAMRVSGL